MKNDYSHMMLDYFIRRTRALNQERKNILQNIKTKDQAEEYQSNVTQIIKKSFFPVMPEKTPLNPVITGTLKRKGYRIEKLLFESRPECLVSANLYIPENFEPPFPSVVAPCGHSAEGKAEPKYQEFSQRLVHNGFLVLIYDPFNQGERDQYTVLPKNSYLRRSCVVAHNMMGKQLQLIDEFFGSWRVWDGIRALDYVLTRQEADKKFLGVTGNSGGGTLTTWLWAVEPRFTVAAPSCFITPFLYNLENELPQDIEQNPPDILANRIELGDFFISRAPSSLILLGQKYDYFDIRGFNEICKEVEKFYDIFNAKENFEFFIGNNPHGYYSDAQKAMVSFFCKIAGKKHTKHEIEINIEKPETLFATEKGNVIKQGSKPIYIMIGEKVDEIEKNREKLSVHKMKVILKKLFGIPETIEIPHYRVLRPYSLKKKTIARYGIETEKEIWIILKKKVENSEHIFNLEIENEINLCLPDICSEDEILNERKFLKKCAEYFIDVRGMGESMPEEKKNFFRPYGYDFMIDRFYYMFGESYLGKRIFDVLSTIQLIKSKGCKTINLYGNRQGAIIGLFVALFSEEIKNIYLEKLPESFSKLAQVPSTKLPSSNFQKGLLKITDIPEIIKEIKSLMDVHIIR